MSAPVHVMVSGAAGNIGYALLPLLANGSTFGDRRVFLHLLDIPRALEALNGVRMELEDGAYPQLAGVSCSSSAEEALSGVDVAVFVGGFPRGKGMLRKDLIAKNCGIFSAQGKALEKVASKNVKILVVANPANTNCLILKSNAPSIPAANFTALTFLDSNRARSLLAGRVGVPVDSVKRVAIFGNHSATQYPDATNAVVDMGVNEVPLAPLVGDDEWLQGDFVKTVASRGKAVINARGASSAMSAANAIKDHLRTWLVTGTAAGECASMAVPSDGNPYGIRSGLMYSFPVTIKHGEIRIVPGFKLNAKAQAYLKKTEAELLEEKADADAALAASRL